MKLSYINDDIQNTAEAIESVLNIDVTIVNEDLVRVAGTGVYLDKIGEKVNEHSAFKRSYSDKKVVFVDDPKSSLICRDCYCNNHCKEYAEVCCPIVYEGESYGVIGLIAFTKGQADLIKCKEKDLVNFLGKMADLISNKIRAHIKTYELELEKKKLETLLNNMDKAIVSVNVDGQIDKYNSKFAEVFSLRSNLSGNKIYNILPFINKQTFNTFNSEKKYSFYYKNKSIEYKGVYTVNKIMLNGELKGYVIDFIDKKEAIKNYNKINKNYKIKLDSIIGESEAIKRSKKEAFIASKSTSTVLITGESGTGKELFARAIHNHSDRSDNPFITINCAAIPDNLLESELFGYEEGAFTGAKKGGKIGIFELANKGSIFLDEIGDMSLHLQAKLLRVLQEKELSKIGGKSNIYIDVRIIAATNKNLEKMVLEGTFREDLFYRLNVIPIKLPSLRERKTDIPLFIDFMIREYSKKLNKNVIGVDDDVVKKFINYSWPGNIRELQNTIEYSVNMSTKDKISLDIIPNKIVIKKQITSEQNGEIRKLEDIEKEEILKALKKFRDFKKDKEIVARELGISRATLYRKIYKYKIRI